MISERCKRLIVIFSNAFFNKSDSRKNTNHFFFATFAQAIGIEQRERKIIPCFNIYKDTENCVVPDQFRYYYALRLGPERCEKPESRYISFWNKLRDSIKSVPETTSRQIMPR